jgi:hypothetical protein
MGDLKGKAPQENATAHNLAATEKILITDLLGKAGDGRCFRGIDLKHGDQLGHLQDFLKFRAEMAQI